MNRKIPEHHWETLPESERIVFYGYLWFRVARFWKQKRFRPLPFPVTFGLVTTFYIFALLVGISFAAPVGFVAITSGWLLVIVMGGAVSLSVITHL